MDVNDKELWLNSNGRFSFFIEDGSYNGKWKAIRNNRIIVGLFTCTSDSHEGLIDKMYEDIKEYLYIICWDKDKKAYDARR